MDGLPPPPAFHLNHGAANGSSSTARRRDRRPSYVSTSAHSPTALERAAVQSQLGFEGRNSWAHPGPASVIMMDTHADHDTTAQAWLGASQTRYVDDPVAYDTWLPDRDGNVRHTSEGLVSPWTNRRQSDTSSTPRLSRRNVSLLAQSRHPCLRPLLPYLDGVVPIPLACDLFDVYLRDPGTSFFHHSSPYVLSRIFRKKALLGQTDHRQLSPALLATILWVSAQTADVKALSLPGARTKLTDTLLSLVMFLLDPRHRSHQSHQANPDQHPTSTRANGFGGMGTDGCAGFGVDDGDPDQTLDDILTYTLLCICISGGDYKSECVIWRDKAMRLAIRVGLHREDEPCPSVGSACTKYLCACRVDSDDAWLPRLEAKEERRRVFWLLYALDRHLALSYNQASLHLPDSICEVYSPLPEDIWENLETYATDSQFTRILGPPILVSGTSFLEYFLPLMAILGDIMEIHHRRHHPRFGSMDDAQAVNAVDEMILACKASVEEIGASDVEFPLQTPSAFGLDVLRINNIITGQAQAQAQAQAHVQDHLRGDEEELPIEDCSPTAATGANSHNAVPHQHQHNQHQHHRQNKQDKAVATLVVAYSTHILHVLQVLLHGKWDAISMMDDCDGWITSPAFPRCASHAVAASETLSEILRLDPELVFMPYLLGIYLLHGSFILLLFAERMPQLGPNQSVETACETIIRAHEVCVVTLSTQFQKNFRRIVRSTLHNVREVSYVELEEHKRTRREILSLYRWTKGAKGLCI
jgi:hypothetical protein